MKLTIKTLSQNSTFKIDIEPDKTVKELKDAIEKEQGDIYPSGSQKLIYNGKILADENKLSEYEFDEKKFIVLMVTRPPPAPKPIVPAESASNKQKIEEKLKSSSATPTTRQQQASSSTTAATTVSSTPASATAAPTTTISTTTASNTATQQPPASGRNARLSDVAGLSMGEPQIAARLASIMTQPHFRQMQDLIQQSPHLLSSTIESLAASDPEMLSFMNENPDIFVNALNHPPLAGVRSSGQQAAGGVAGQRGGAPAQVRSGGAGQQPVVDQLLGNVSEHDKEAIERLKELGFSEYLAVQAYMACDKDEQLAANLLFQMEQ